MGKLIAIFGIFFVLTGCGANTNLVEENKRLEIELSSTKEELQNTKVKLEEVQKELDEVKRQLEESKKNEVKVVEIIK